MNQFIPDAPSPAPLRHQTGHYLRIADRIGAHLSEALLQEVHRAAEPGLAGLCPGAEYGPAKRWTEFGLAASQLSERRGIHWLIFGTANERLLAAEIMKTLGTSPTDLTGRTSLLELAAQLRRCRLLLTNDTGTMHLAAFLGVPTVSIFGSTEPQLTRPIRESHVVIRHHVECSPCFLRKCPLDFRYIKAVTGGEVAAPVGRPLGHPPRPFRFHPPRTTPN